MLKIFDIIIALVLLAIVGRSFGLTDKIMNNNLSSYDMFALVVILIVIFSFIMRIRNLYKNFPISYGKFIKEKGKPIKKFSLFLKYSRKKLPIYTKRRESAKICVFEDCVVLTMSSRVALINSQNLVFEDNLPRYTNLALRIGDEVYYFESESEPSDIIDLLNK